MKVKNLKPIEQARFRFSTISKENFSNEHLAQLLDSLMDFAKQQLILNARLEQVLLQNEGQSNLVSPSNITKAPENGNKKLKKKSAKTNDEKFIIIIIIIIKTLFCITEKDNIKPLRCIHALQTISKSQ